MPRDFDASNRADGQADAIELGRRLFIDKRLSANNKLSCASRHSSWLIFSLSISKPAGKPSTIATNALPCDSPEVVNLNCIIYFYHLHHYTLANSFTTKSKH